MGGRVGERKEERGRKGEKTIKQPLSIFRLVYSESKRGLKRVSDITHYSLRILVIDPTEKMGERHCCVC